MEPGKFRTGDLGKLTSDGFLCITGRVKSQFKLQNGKYVSPAPLEENVKLSPYVEGAVLDGRNMVKTYLIVHPNMHALKAGLTAANVKFPNDDAEICKDQNVKNWLLTELKTNNMVAPAWKGYETAGSIILDHEEWTTDNDLLTPSMKVKLRNLLTKHDDAINNL
jgi:long-chain acyl-CoA synthetase